MAAILFKSRVLKVEHKHKTISVRVARNPDGSPVTGPDGKPQTIEERADLGWFVQLEGSRESTHAGMDEPPFRPGDTIEVVIRHPQQAA